jgi:hypothetical protein
MNRGVGSAGFAGIGDEIVPWTRRRTSKLSLDGRWRRSAVTPQRLSLFSDDDLRKQHERSGRGVSPVE